MNIPLPLQSLISDPRVTDILINGYDQVYFEKGNGLELLHLDPTQDENAVFKNENEFRTFVLEQISLSGKTWDAKLPFLDTVFFQSLRPHRAHISFPPLAQFGIILSLRKLPNRDVRSKTIAQEEARARWQDPQQKNPAFELLVKAIAEKETLLFAGGTGSGKTTLLNDLLCFVPENERMIALEDTAEIRPCHPHFLSLLSRTANADGFGLVSLRDLLRQTLRMRPDRILVGECRGDEVLDLLQSLNTGHRGTLGTLHANSARDALRRIELLALLAAKGTIPAALIKELMANGIQKLVFLDRVAGKRKIKTILQIEGHERDIIFTRPVFEDTKPLLTLI